MRRFVVVALIVVAILGSSAALSLRKPGASAAIQSGAVTTAERPPGILLAPVQVGSGAGGGTAQGMRGNRGRISVAFTDSELRPLYYAKTSAGAKAECSGSCLEKWRPAEAWTNAKAVADWSVVTGPEGVRQWAYRGHPLYTYVAEAAYEDDYHVIHGQRLYRPLAGHGVDGIWNVAEANPAQWMELPPAFSTTEIPLAPGQVLITSKGQPLYAFSGKASDEGNLPALLQPRRAAVLDVPIGDFTIRKRFDGTLQWAYRGAPLFTCECDVEAGDLNGKNRVSGLAPVVLLPYFMPQGVELRSNQLTGGRMVETQTGQSLYYRERTMHRDFKPDNQRTIHRMDPTVGKTLGISHCDAQCEKSWQPLLAPRDAQPRDYWTLIERVDGTRQWAYHHYALYTYANEPPGTTYGDGTWTVRFDNGLQAEKVPDPFGMALFWRAVIP